ncbi:MAG: hypothetical protein V7K55_05005 [Nostoc sp.]|uniref:hypothetical protein n=1 Tax=Nostoc sp. TaxID=1180 RepID=UPI002FF5FE03
MNLIDAIVLTLINAAACMAFPKLVAILLDNKTKANQVLRNASKLQIAKIELTSFPYCTAYSLTGSQYCKFNPDFCSNCSPN